MSLLLLTVTLWGVSNKHCLLSLGSFVSDLVKKSYGRFFFMRFTVMILNFRTDSSGQTVQT